MENSLKIVSVGGFSAYGESNTCLHRTWALEKIADVTRVDTAKTPQNNYSRLANKLFRSGFPVRLPDPNRIHTQILNTVKNTACDIIWVDKGLLVDSRTIKALKKINPQGTIVLYSPDDMSQRHNQSQNFLDALPYYDLIVTTKSYTVDKLKRLGARKVLFVDNAYEDSFHYPRNLDKTDIERLGGDVGFVGTWEQERADSITYLAKNGISVRVWGGGKWLQYKDRYPNLRIEEKGLFSEDYSKAFPAFRISLCFLRKMNHDLQTTRTLEIPACGGFMLAERTQEQQNLFTEGKEAEFFSDDTELLEKCRYYLTHETERVAIAANGLERCRTSGYSNRERVKKMVEYCLALPKS